MLPNRFLRRWGLYVVAGTMAAACLLPVACINNEPAAERGTFSAVTATCPATPHVCTVDEINSDACPFVATALALPSGSDYEDDPVFDEGAEADFHKLTLDESGNVTGDTVTPLEGEYAWELIYGVPFWWDHHPDNEKFTSQGIFDDDEVQAPELGFVFASFPEDDPLYVTCDQAKPFTVEIPGAIPPSQDAIDNQDCYALAYATGVNVKKWLENNGVDDHVLMSFPAPCPWIDDGGGDTFKRLKRVNVPRPNAGPPPPEQPHPNQVILGRKFSNFNSVAGRRAWEAAAQVQRNQTRGTQQLFANFDDGATINLATDVMIVGGGPGGGTLVTMYGNRATLLTNNQAWQGRPEYEVVQSKLRTVEFVNPNFRDADILSTDLLQSSLHATTRPDVVLGYQPGFMDLVMANATEHHIYGTANAYWIEEGELMVQARPEFGSQVRSYTWRIPAGKAVWDATGMLDTPRVRANMFDTTVPNQIGDPPMKAWGVTLLDSGQVTTLLNGRNLNTGDLAKLSPTDFHTAFDGQTAIILGSGGASFQTLGMILGKSTGKVVMVYNADDVANTFRDPNLNQGESKIGLDAFANNDPRIIKRPTTAKLSNLGTIEGLGLGLARVDANTVSLELRNVPGLVTPDPIRADWMVSCAGPIDTDTLIPMDFSVVNTLEVVYMNLNGQNLPMFIRGAGGRLVLDFNASTKVARYVVELARKGAEPRLMLPEATLAQMADLGAKRGQVGAALQAMSGRSALYPYEQAAAANAQIYRAVEGAPKKIVLPGAAPANDNRRVPANDNRRIPTDDKRRIQLRGSRNVRAARTANGR